MSTMNVAATSSTTSSPTGSSSRDLLNPDSFLTLLLAELQTQDPLDPMDTQAMVSQLSNMQMVADSRAVRQNQEFAQATNLLGRSIVWQDANTGSPTSGEVTGVTRDDAGPQLTVDGTTVSLDDVQRVY